jgi:two-component system CheB/CheR fusion protein
VSPAAALVNGRGDILFLHGRTGSFLEPASGETGISNIVHMAREGLQRELAAALRDAAKTKAAVRRTGLRVRTNGSFSTVELAIHPVAADPAAVPEVPLYLVTLEEVSNVDAEGAQQAARSGGPGLDGQGTDAEASLAALRQELRAKEELVQTTNEELETSREELQSVNEELVTTNAELQTRVVDLSRVNDDMPNLLAGTGIGTLFVDQQLRILGFTPAATGIIHLLSGDVGRPVAHVVSNLVGYDRLAVDAEAVLETLVPKELEVETTQGTWYTMRMLPYRTLENVIEGVVITFADITEAKQARAELEDARGVRRLAIVARDSSDALAVNDLKGRILAWNPAAERLYGWTEAEALAMHFHDLVPADRWEVDFAKVRKLAEAGDLEPYRAERITKTGAVITVLARVAALFDGSGAMYAIATTERRAPSGGDPE